MKIVVKDIIEKPIAISTEDGKKTKEAIKSLFDKNEDIEVSFEGINMLISHFLISSIYIIPHPSRDTYFNLKNPQ